MVRSKGSPLKASVDELVRTTEVRSADLDNRFYSLLEQLQQKGRALDGLRSVTVSLQGLERERILNWRAYVYTLLRKFDEAAYQAMKSHHPEDEQNVETAEKDKGATTNGVSEFNVSAPEFVPGGYWGGNLAGATPMSNQDFSGMPTSPMNFIDPFAMPMMPISPMNFIDPFSSPAPKGQLEKAMGSGVKLPKKAMKSMRPEPGSPQVGSPSLSKLLNLDHELGLGLADGQLPMAPPLPTGMAAMPTPGSAGHSAGTCKPCAFLHTKGCANAADCQFCHLCGPEEKKRRKRVKGYATASY